MRHGWNSAAYQILNPGIQHWFHPDGDAVVGYVRKHRYLLVAGAPVCAPQELSAITQAFEQFAAQQSRRVCYVCASQRLRDLFQNSPQHCEVAVGAEPVWNPLHWPDILQRRRSLRAQLHRARNKSVQIEETDAASAAGAPEFHRVLTDWIANRGLPPLHFMVEPEILRGVLDDRLVFAARRHNRLVAYLIASPIAARNGYLIEELARSREAPNGTSELLIDAAMRRFAAANCDYVTMGLVALSGDELKRNPAWLRALMFFARAHANRFYNFQGLEQFRSKMEPSHWESISFIANEKRFSLSALYAVGAAFSGISPIRAVALGAIKGALQEIRNLRPRAR
jgi:phosphatidylglycerol lysyltransferase